MNHSFQKPPNNEDKCIKCTYPEAAHGDYECECCSNVGPVEIRYGNMLMCATCWQKEQEATKKHMSPEAQQQRVNDYLDRTRQIDAQSKISADVFNAATIPAIELRQSIQADETIIPSDKDKLYTQECMRRYLHFKEVIFGKREELLKMENEMRMYQVQVRSMAHTLSKELQEQFKAADISYTPQAPKTIKPTTTPRPKKFDKDAVIAAANKFKVPMQAVQMLVVAQNISPEDAARKLAEAGGNK